MGLVYRLVEETEFSPHFQITSFSTKTMKITLCLVILCFALILRFQPGGGYAISSQQEKSDIPDALFQHSRLDNKSNRHKRSCIEAALECETTSQCCQYDANMICFWANGYLGMRHYCIH